jgi:hypothetical protein
MIVIAKTMRFTNAPGTIAEASKQGISGPKRNNAALYNNSNNIAQLHSSGNAYGNKLEGLYKYFVGGGNNGDLVRRVMRRREGWVETKENSSMFVQFKW